MIIDGKIIANDIIERLKSQPNRTSSLARFATGDDPASINFLKQKEKVAKELDIEFRLYQLPETLTTDELRAEIGRLSAPKNCSGFIVQLPLPENINRYYILNAIPKDKGCGLFERDSARAFYTERGKIAPPSVSTVEEILKTGASQFASDLKAVMVGAGFLIGKPVGLVTEQDRGTGGARRARKGLSPGD